MRRALNRCMGYVYLDLNWNGRRKWGGEEGVDGRDKERVKKGRKRVVKGV